MQYPASARCCRGGPHSSHSMAGWHCINLPYIMWQAPVGYTAPALTPISLAECASYAWHTTWIPSLTTRAWWMEDKFAQNFLDSECSVTDGRMCRLNAAHCYASVHDFHVGYFSDRSLCLSISLFYSPSLRAKSSCMCVAKSCYWHAVAAHTDIVLIDWTSSIDNLQHRLYSRCCTYTYRMDASNQLCLTNTNV